MTSTTTTPSFALAPSLKTAWQDVDSSFERFCLTAGIEAVSKCCARMPRISPANRIAGAATEWGIAGAEPKARSASTAARLWSVARGCVAMTAMSLRCRPGRRRGGGLAWPLGHEPHADQRLDAQAEACCATAGG